MPTRESTSKRVRAEKKRVEALILQATRNKAQQKLTVVPCTIDQANAFVQQMHRHHGSIPIARLAFAVADAAGVVRETIPNRVLASHVPSTQKLVLFLSVKLPTGEYLPRSAVKNQHPVWNGLQYRLLYVRQKQSTSSQRPYWFV